MINESFFGQVESTLDSHDGVQLTQYQNEPFIIGDYKHNKIEFMHLFHQKWYSATNFYTDSKKPIFGFAAVSRPDKVFILGGCYDHSSAVSIFENHEWRHYYDRLAYKRMNFMTITYGTDVFLFGGGTKFNNT